MHAESHELITWITKRLIDAKLTLPRYHSVARPALAEREATHRAVTFAELIGTPLLLVHVSSVSRLLIASGLRLDCLLMTS